MNVHELKELVFGGESERVEFKRSTGQRTEAAKTTCGMLNGLGGFVLFGVTDSGNIVGQQGSAKTLEDMVAVLRRIEPPAFPDIETINLKKGVSIPHESKPWNPIIANVFYRAGVIERWGTGTLNIIDRCAENANSAPSWQEQAGSVYVSFLPAVLPNTGKVGGYNETHQGPESIKWRVIATLATRPLSKSEIATALGHTSISGKLNQRIRQMLSDGYIEYTIPDKPNSRLQKYRLTEKGRELNVK